MKIKIIHKNKNKKYEEKLNDITDYFLLSILLKISFTYKKHRY